MLEISSLPSPFESEGQRMPEGILMMCRKIVMDDRWSRKQVNLGGSRNSPPAALCGRWSNPIPGNIVKHGKPRNSRGIPEESPKHLGIYQSTLLSSGLDTLNHRFAIPIVCIYVAYGGSELSRLSVNGSRDGFLKGFWCRCLS